MPMSFRIFVNHAPATTPIYTLSLHDALPISQGGQFVLPEAREQPDRGHVLGHLLGPRSAEEHAGHERVRERKGERERGQRDRKSTRLNSSHVEISYAVFCLKKKKSHQRSPSN